MIRLSIIMACLCGALSLAGAAGIELRTAPEVGPKEETVLAAVMRVSETNAAAALVLLESTQVAEQSAATDYVFGNLHFQLDDLSKAASAYESALEKLPSYRDALNNLGRVYVLQEKGAKAVGLFRTILETGHAGADVFQLLGQALLADGKVVSAENAFREVMLRRPDDADAERGLAKCLLDQGRHAEALGLVTELLGRRPADSELWGLRANLLIELERPLEAIAAIETARRVSAVSADVLMVLGDLYIRRLQPRLAQPIYEEAFKVSPATMERLVHSAAAFLSINDQRACNGLLNRAKKMLETQPDKGSPEKRVLVARGRAAYFLAANKLEDARKECDVVLALKPLDAKTLLNAGEIYRLQGKFNDAVLMFRRAGGLDGYHAQAQVKEAQVDVARDNIPKAIRLLESAQETDPQPHVARYLKRLRAL